MTVAGNVVRTAKGERTRQRLLEVATAELLDRGGHLELGSVARRAGISPSVVSHHFGSRAGLIGAVLEGFFERLHTTVLDLDLRALGDWPTREFERLRRGVRFHYEEPLAEVLYRSLSREPEVAAVEARRLRALIQQSARNVRSGQRAGDLPSGIDPTLAAASMFGAMREVVPVALSRNSRPSQKTVLNQLWRVTAAAVGLDPRSQP